MMTATQVRTDADTADFSQIFLSDAPLMDVRAPVEFIKGAFPYTDNFPILNDEHRALVGTCYKEEGSEAAKQLGYELVVESNLKEKLVVGWKAFAEANPNGYLYCFRGGMRSHITQTWLKEAGIDYPLVQGGYKAMRTFLMSETERLAEELPIVLIGGRTGSGKTHLLKRLGRHVDLEGLAKHRGSSFGRLVEEQPAQIDFENSLGIDLIKAEHESDSPVFMEDEGRRIGQRNLPVGLFAQMSERYPLVILEEPMEERVKTCIRDYVTDLFPLFQEHFGPDECGAEYIKWSTEALFRVKKRLGGDRYAEVNGQITTALESYLSSGDESGFEIPVRTILGDFYDPMYDYQLEDRKDQILFRGTADEIVEWAKTYSTKNYAEAV
jgi:tRNA 2-selenouridine synthase